MRGVGRERVGGVWDVGCGMWDMGCGTSFCHTIREASKAMEVVPFGTLVYREKSSSNLLIAAQIIKSKILFKSIFPHVSLL